MSFMSWIRSHFAEKKPESSFPEGVDMQEILSATGGPTVVPGEYYAISGVDVKVYFENEQGEFTSVPEVQAVSCVQNKDGSAKGSILTIIFDGDVMAELKALNRIKHMLLVAATEKGVIAYMKLKDITLEDSEWTVTVDDLIMKQTTNYIAESCTPWTCVMNPLPNKENRSVVTNEQRLEKLRSFK